MFRQKTKVEHIMQFDEIRVVLHNILVQPENLGKYLSAEQICATMKKDYAKVWKELCACYPTTESDATYASFNYKYTPQAFVEKALVYYSSNNGIPGLEQSEINVLPCKLEHERHSSLVWRLS